MYVGCPPITTPQQHLNNGVQFVEFLFLKAQLIRQPQKFQEMFQFGSLMTHVALSKWIPNPVEKSNQIAIKMRLLAETFFTKSIHQPPREKLHSWCEHTKSHDESIVNQL